MRIWALIHANIFSMNIPTLTLIPKRGEQMTSACQFTLLLTFKIEIPWKAICRGQHVGKATIGSLNISPIFPGYNTMPIAKKLAAPFPNAIYLCTAPSG